MGEMGNTSTYFDLLRLRSVTRSVTRSVCQMGEMGEMRKMRLLGKSVRFLTAEAAKPCTYWVKKWLKTLVWYTFYTHAASPNF